MRTIKEALAARIDPAGEEAFVRTPISVREAAERLVRREGRPAPAMARIVDAVVPGGEYDVPVRFFIPREGPLPVLVYYHGGGFAAGSVPLYGRICRRLAHAADCIVAAPEYRLAPENPCPAAETDALAAARGVRGLLDAMDIPHGPALYLGGDSAGGALSALVSEAMQDDGGAPEKQILIYPWLDMTASLPSVEENCRGETGFPRAELQWYLRQYFRACGDLRGHSPLFGRVTARLPEILLITAEFCPFRDEGAAYLSRLRAAGVRTERLHFKHMTHTFLKYETACASEVRQVYARAADFFRR